MKEERRGIPRSKLIGMQVYNPNGSFIGTIKDLSLDIGTGEIGLLVSTKYQTETEIPWSNIGAAEDIIILKEAVKVEPPPTATPVAPTSPITPRVEEKRERGLFRGIMPKREKKLCPTCGQNLYFIKQYSRWYCYNCGKYAD